MKTLIGVIITILLLVVVAFTQKSSNQEVKTNEVYSVHDLELKDGVDEKEFEAFVLKEIAPFYSKLKGQDCYLVKGDRGVLRAVEQPDAIVSQVSRVSQLTCAGICTDSGGNFRHGQRFFRLLHK